MFQRWIAVAYYRVYKPGAIASSGFKGSVSNWAFMLHVHGRGKSSFKVYIILVVLTVLFIIFNQVDAPPPVNVFSQEDQVPATFDKTNGFYLVLSLIEPREVDVCSAYSNAHE